MWKCKDCDCFFSIWKCQWQFNKYLSCKHFNHSGAFIEYSNGVDYTYGNTEKCNPNKKRKIFTVFDDMISDMLSNKKKESNSNWITC